MLWLIAIGLIAIVLIAMNIAERLVRAVGQKLPAPYIFERCVMPWMLKGLNGTRAVMYHPGANTLIQVIKSLSPIMPDGQVRLRVTKSRLPKGKMYNPERGRVLPIRRLPYPDRLVARWRLPSTKEGDVVLDIDCGASLNRVHTSIQQIILECPAMAEAPTFYVWCEKGSGWRVWGKFEDLEAGEQ